MRQLTGMVLWLALGAWPSLSIAQTGANVVVIINDDSPASRQVGEYYASKRDVPVANVIRIKAPTTPSITRAEFAASIETPISQALVRQGLQDRVL